LDDEDVERELVKGPTTEEVPNPPDQDNVEHHPVEEPSVADTPTPSLSKKEKKKKGKGKAALLWEDSPTTSAESEPEPFADTPTPPDGEAVEQVSVEESTVEGPTVVETSVRWLSEKDKKKKRKGTFDWEDTQTTPAESEPEPSADIPTPLDDETVERGMVEEPTASEISTPLLSKKEKKKKKNKGVLVWEDSSTAPAEPEPFEDIPTPVDVEDVEQVSVEEPTVREPTVEEPTVDEPTVEELSVDDPSVEKEPTVEEPSVEKEFTVENQPTVEEPSVDKEPTPEEPTEAEASVHGLSKKGKKKKKKGMFDWEDTPVTPAESEPEPSADIPIPLNNNTVEPLPTEEPPVSDIPTPALSKKDRKKKKGKTALLWEDSPVATEAEPSADIPISANEDNLQYTPLEEPTVAELPNPAFGKKDKKKKKKGKGAPLWEDSPTTAAESGPAANIDPFDSDKFDTETLPTDLSKEEVFDSTPAIDHLYTKDVIMEDSQPSLSEPPAEPAPEYHPHSETVTSSLVEDTASPLACDPQLDSTNILGPSENDKFEAETQPVTLSKKGKKKSKKNKAAAYDWTSPDNSQDTQDVMPEVSQSSISELPVETAPMSEAHSETVERSLVVEGTATPTAHSPQLNVSGSHGDEDKHISEDLNTSLEDPVKAVDSSAVDEFAGGSTNDPVTSTPIEATLFNVSADETSSIPAFVTPEVESTATETDQTETTLEDYPPVALVAEEPMDIEPATLEPTASGRTAKKNKKEKRKGKQRALFEPEPAVELANDDNNDTGTPAEESESTPQISDSGEIEQSPLELRGQIESKPTPFEPTVVESTAAEATDSFRTAKKTKKEKRKAKKQVLFDPQPDVEIANDDNDIFVPPVEESESAHHISGPSESERLPLEPQGEVEEKSDEHTEYQLLPQEALPTAQRDLDIGEQDRVESISNISSGVEHPAFHLPSSTIEDQTMVEAAMIERQTQDDLDQSTDSNASRFDLAPTPFADPVYAPLLNDNTPPTQDVDTVVEERRGSTEKDIDFAATLAAGLAESGFDPDLVLKDPQYYRGSSPSRVTDTSRLDQLKEEKIDSGITRMELDEDRPGAISPRTSGAAADIGSEVLGSVSLPLTQASGSPSFNPVDILNDPIFSQRRTPPGSLEEPDPEELWTSTQSKRKGKGKKKKKQSVTSALTSQEPSIQNTPQLSPEKEIVEEVQYPSLDNQIVLNESQPSSSSHDEGSRQQEETRVLDPSPEAPSVELGHSTREENLEMSESHTPNQAHMETADPFDTLTSEKEAESSWSVPSKKGKGKKGKKGAQNRNKAPLLEEETSSTPLNAPINEAPAASVDIEAPTSHSPTIEAQDIVTPVVTAAVVETAKDVLLANVQNDDVPSARDSTGQDQVVYNQAVKDPVVGVLPPEIQPVEVRSAEVQSNDAPIFDLTAAPHDFEPVNRNILTAEPLQSKGEDTLPSLLYEEPQPSKTASDVADISAKGFTDFHQELEESKTQPTDSQPAQLNPGVGDEIDERVRSESPTQVYTKEDVKEVPSKGKGKKGKAKRKHSTIVENPQEGRGLEVADSSNTQVEVVQKDVTDEVVVQEGEKAWQTEEDGWLGSKKKAKKSKKKGKSGSATPAEERTMTETAAISNNDPQIHPEAPLPATERADTIFSERGEQYAGPQGTADRHVDDQQTPAEAVSTSDRLETSRALEFMKSTTGAVHEFETGDATVSPPVTDREMQGKVPILAMAEKSPRERISPDIRRPSTPSPTMDAHDASAKESPSLNSPSLERAKRRVRRNSPPEGEPGEKRVHLSVNEKLDAPLVRFGNTPQASPPTHSLSSSAQFSDARPVSSGTDFHSAIRDSGYHEGEMSQTLQRSPLGSLKEFGTGPANANVRSANLDLPSMDWAPVGVASEQNDHRQARERSSSPLPEPKSPVGIFTPSAVDSATKERTSYLFNSSPSTRGYVQENIGFSPPEALRVSKTRGRRQPSITSPIQPRTDTTPEIRSSPPETHEDVEQSMVRNNKKGSREAAHDSPSKRRSTPKLQYQSLFGDPTERRTEPAAPYVTPSKHSVPSSAPLGTITETSPDERLTKPQTPAPRTPSALGDRNRTPVSRPLSAASHHSHLSHRSATPPLRRVDRKLSGDLRAASRRGGVVSAVSAAAVPDLPGPSTTPAPSAAYDPVRDKGKGRALDMPDVFEAWGEAQGSPMSPTRPPSVRKRQSMQIMDLQVQLETLAAQNRSLEEAKAKAEEAIQAANYQTQVDSQVVTEAIDARDREIRQKDIDIAQLRDTLRSLQQEVARLTELNQTLSDANRHLTADTNERYAQLQSEGAHAYQQWQETSKALEELRSQHTHLTTGMEEVVRHEIALALDDRNAEIKRLNAELANAREQVKTLQRQILASKQGESFLIVRDEDYFDSACQQLCQHVQQWVLRFSKFSDTRACRLSSEVASDPKIDPATREKIETRLDNAILDGSDVDMLLADRVKRRDVFMSVVMTMIWEYVFTRYLFGMDREQRQKLKSLEKTLSEVGPTRAVAQWRAITLTLLSKRDAFVQQRAQDTEAVVHEIYSTLSTLLPPPNHLQKQTMESLRNVMRLAVELSIEMRTQRAEYIMLPPLQPEYNTNGDLVAKVTFNASLMNERSGETTSNDELEARSAIVKIVLFPLVVKKGDDFGEGEDEIVVCPAQVLVGKPPTNKKVVRVLSGAMDIDSRHGRSMASLIPESSIMDTSSNMI
jgi:hypothetical protein